MSLGAAVLMGSVYFVVGAIVALVAFAILLFDALPEDDEDKLALEAPLEMSPQRELVFSLVVAIVGGLIWPGWPLLIVYGKSGSWDKPQQVR